MELRYEVIAAGALPHGLILAGGGFEPVTMPRAVFQVRYADDAYVLIDTAYDRALRRVHGTGEVDLVVSHDARTFETGAFREGFLPPTP